MSQQAAATFRALVGSDSELQHEVAAALQGQPDIDAIVALGAARGCEFTVDEANSLIQASVGANASGELNDFELQLVAGGANKNIQTAIPGSTAPDARYGASTVTRGNAKSVMAAAKLGRF